LERFDREQPNFRTALAFALGAGQNANAAQALSGALARFWLIRAYVAEGVQWVRSALAAQGEATRVRARLLWGAAILANRHGEDELCRQMTEECASLSRALGDPLGLARVNRFRALYLLWQDGYPDQARRAAEEALATAEEHDDGNLQARVHMSL